MSNDNNFPSMKKSDFTLNIMQKPTVLKYSDVLKQKKININNSLKFNEITDKEAKNETKTDKLIKSISEKTKKLALDNSIEFNESNKINKNTNHKLNQDDLQNKYKNNIDNIIKIQAWWRMISIMKSIKNIEKNKVDKKDDKKENEKKENIQKKTLPKKPSFSDIVKLAPSTETKQLKKSGIKSITNNDNNKNKKINGEEINSILKNMKFMGLIEKEIDDLTEKNTIVNGKQFAKTKVVTIKKFSRSSSNSSFNINDIIENDNKKKNGKNENKSNNKKRLKKNVSFNEKDEVFNEYNHVMKKLDLHIRCDKKSCLIDCYRRLYKKDWEENIIEDNDSISENEENTESTSIKKSDYLYNDIYNPNYSKYYSGSDYDIRNRYFTGKERLKKALHLEPVEVTVQKIIYQPMKSSKNNKRNNQQKRKNGNNNKRRQK